jgi:NADH-quinone oxidoreductase subunit M
MVIVGTFQRYPVFAVVAAIGVILAAVYILLWYKKLATGPAPALTVPVPDMNLREKFVVAPLIAAFLVLGFYPKPVLDLLEPAVTATLQTVGVSDPAPTADLEGSDR